MSNINLFVNFSCFDFKDIAHIKGQIFYLEKKFYNIIKEKENYSPLGLENFLVGNQSQVYLFYTGLENKCRKLCKSHLEKVNNIMKNSILQSSEENNFDKTIFIKIKLNINHHKEKSLLCILVTRHKLIVNEHKSELKFEDNSHYIMNYYLFPIGFSDYHN